VSTGPGRWPASCRSSMTKSKTRVRHLTLAPGSDLREAVDVGNQVKEDDEYRRMLQREQMARATEISLLDGHGKHQKPHIHGVGHVKGPKFWAAGDDYWSAESVFSSDESDEEEETLTPVLVKQALEAGFTVDQIRQAAEAKLDTPPTEPYKVCTELHEGSSLS
jgi:hypothetical protein